MAIVVNMPRLSDTMEEGTVATWLKKVGDKVEEGDILAEIETDKATMEFESFNEGTLLHIGVQEGETTKVDELLAVIGDEGEDISDILNGSASTEAKEETPKANDASKEDEKSEESSSKDENANSEDESTPAPSGRAGEGLPEGVIVVTMPRLSDTMEEGTVATWLKKVGDKVEEGDILAEIETDKATMEFESFQSGTLLEIGLQEGESAKVDALLAIIGPEGTDVSGVAANFSSGSAPAKKEAKEETKDEVSKAETATGTKPSAPKPTPVTANGRVFVSPLAKKLAEEYKKLYTSFLQCFSW